jgi:hypothetical protein
MGLTPTKEAIIGQFINGRNAQDDFLQLASNRGGTVFGWIDADGLLQGTLSSISGLTGAPGGLLIIPTATTEPTLSVSAKGTTGSTGYTYRVIARKGVLPIGDSGAVAITNGNATLNGTNYNQLTWTAQLGADSYDVYRTISNGTPNTQGLLLNTVSLTVNDTGLAIISVILPYLDAVNSLRSENGYVGIATGLQVGTSLTTFPAFSSSNGIFPPINGGTAVFSVNALPVAGVSSGDAVGIAITAETTASITGQGSTALGLDINCAATDDADNRNTVAGLDIDLRFNIPAGTNLTSQNAILIQYEVFGAGNMGNTGDVNQGGILTSLGCGLTGTMGQLQAHTSEVNNYSTGTITNLFHFIVNEQDNGGGGAITNAYGFAANISLSNASTFSAAFYSADQGTSAGHWAVYTAGSTPSKFGGSAIIGPGLVEKNSIKLNISSAQLLAMPTAVSLIPAPGANKMIIIESATFQYRYVSTAYTIAKPDDALAFVYHGKTSPIGPFIAVTNLLDQVVNTVYGVIWQQTPAPTAQTNCVNLGVDMVLQGTTPGLTLGNGTLEIVIEYSIVDLS